MNGPPVYLDPAERSNLWAADTFRGKNLMAFLGISGLLLFGLSSPGRETVLARNRI